MGQQPRSLAPSRTRSKPVSVVDGEGATHPVQLSPDNAYWTAVPARARKLVMTDTADTVHELALP
jgi:hypothetical protein